MKHFTVYIQFRGRGMAMQVHEFDPFFLVGFTDDGVLQDFGGQLQFDKQGNYMSGAKSMPKDSVDLFRAIKEGVKAYTKEAS